MRRAVAVLAGVGILAGCAGGGPDANEVLRQTAAKLGELKSAESLHLKVIVDPREGDEFGFELEGPFALCDSRPLPRLDVEYTQMAQGESAKVRLISTGEQGFVEVGDNAYKLSDEQEAELHGTCGELLDGGLEQFRVDDWVRDADADSGGDTDTVTGELDLVAVVDDLVDVARAFGRSDLARLDQDDARRLAEATKETRFELESGKDDRLLRRLLLEADVAFDVPERLREALGDLVGAKVTFELELEDPNSPVEVQAPPNPRPSSELPGGNG